MHHAPHHRHGTTSPEASTGKSGLLLFVLLIAQLMVILDITAVNIAQPCSPQHVGARNDMTIAVLPGPVNGPQSS